MSETSINMEARRECEEIMKKIYDENPSYWPYGLDIAAHDGGVYMIREASTKKAIGFTGWQERMQDGVKVGMYSIGILPEYRNNGYAKQAVAKLISIKAANVDQVKALVMKHNTPSIALADALHVPVIKAGSEKQANRNEILKMLLSGVGSAGFMDAYTYGRDKSMEEYLNTPFSVSRGAQGLANLVFGGAAGAPGLSTGARLAALAAIPGKDVAVAAIPAIPSVTESVKTLAEKPEAKSLLEQLSPTQKALGAGVGAAGLLGGGYLGFKAIKALKDMAEAQQQATRGKIRVALPTKDPNDQETTIELPMEDLNIARSQFEKLQRDLRRRVRRETKERTVQRTLGNFMEAKEACAKKDDLVAVKNLLNILHG